MIRKFPRLIKSKLNFTLYLLLLTGITLTFNQNVFAAGKSVPNLLVLGDSLSAAYGININEGWVALLQQKINKQGYDYNVVNASVSGDTTRTGLSRITAVLKQHKPKVVIIALGGNDGLRGLAFQEIENSLINIIELCRKYQAKILLIGVRLPPNYGPFYNQQFANLYQGLAKRYAIPLVPQMLKQVAEYRELIQEDGIHPKSRAQPLILENIWHGLKLILEKNDRK